MSLNELLIFFPSVGMAIASIILWRKQRDGATASMAATQSILVLNVVLISRFLPQLNSVSESLFGSPLAMQRIWFYVTRIAAVVFAIAFILFSVRYVRLANAR